MADNEEREGTILIVDDEYFIQRSLSFMLKKEGFRCLTAGDGEAAIEQVHAGEPELVILDLDLPKKDGYQVCREIQEADSEGRIRIIILTAKGQALDDAKKAEIGTDEYIDKPYAPRVVLDTVLRFFYQDLFKGYSE